MCPACWSQGAKGVTSSAGVFESYLRLPLITKTIAIITPYLGLPDTTFVSVNPGPIDVILGGVKPASKGAATLSPRNWAGKVTYTYMGDWDAAGVPAYLEPQRDDVGPGLLATVNASLPENRPVPQYNPEYLATGNQTDVLITELADVWVTFVHEGAGWKNALGFYTYDLSSPPVTTADIAAHTIIFPNVSYAGSGGGLQSGDRVRIGQFPAGTGIGWFLVSNGWNGAGVGNGNYVVYSNPDFNPEASSNLRQHNVLLTDPDRELLLLSFEDVNREWSSVDNDFNDAVFYVAANPYTALVTSNVVAATDPGKDPGSDADGDGVINELDRFPYESDKAFISFQPGEDVFSTLVFEDLWPNRGDYDFNDLVLDWNVALALNVNGDVVEINGTYKVRAAGAGFRNGFGFELPLPSSSVASVTGTSLNKNYITLSGNGTESGQSRAVIIVFDDTYGVVSPPSGYFANTQPGVPAT